jgi:hypothetical protein
VETVLSNLNGAFTPRTITRNPTSEKVLAPKARGAQVAQADVGDKVSIKQAGCEDVFAVRQVLV